MKILLISFGDVDYDGRLRSLINVFSEMGIVHAFTRGKKPLNDNSRVYNYSYVKFIRAAIRYAKDIGKFDWLVLDNRKATIPGLIIQKKMHPSMTIQDCRELYLMKEVKHFSGKIGCIFERKMVRRADIVICANQERAKIMKQEYGLSREPLAYENLRQLQYGTEDEVNAAQKRLNPYLKDGEYRIVSSSGCSIKRTNDVLVKNLKNVKKPCRLFLVGDSTTEEERTIRQITKELNLDNVVVLGRLNQSELKYLISQSHIGIVNYGQYDTNNRLCASGKLFEFLYEGIPVVTTTNPPLKRICEESVVGVADDTYFDGINRVIDNYDLYRTSVERFVKSHSIEINDGKLIDSINRTELVRNC